MTTVWPTTGAHVIPGENLTVGQVMERIDWLRGIHQPLAAVKQRTQAIMDGGVDAVKHLLGERIANQTDLVPIPPLMVSGLSRLAQKIGGAVPDLKIDPYGYTDSQAAKKASEKRERIVDSYDRGGRLEMQLPQAGRWLPGYGYVMWTIKDRRARDGTRYPYAELRDSYEVYPGPWTGDQQPSEVACISTMTASEMVRQYPDREPSIRAALAGRLTRTAGGAVLLDPNRSRWSNQSGDGFTVAEYWCHDATWVICTDLGVLLQYIPNPIAPDPRFVVAKRFAFNRLNGHYDHVVGLMATMARIRILEYLHMEDSVFTETNVFGEALEGGKYRKGRGAINRFEAGGRVEKPVANLPYQLFQGVDRIERDLRVGADYPVTDDAQHPGGGYATGRGLNALRQDVDLVVREYQKVLRWAIQDLDAVRLAWDEARNSGHRRSVYGFFRDAAYSETYDPKEIRGRYDTRRVFGVMAGWDEPSKIVTGLQLVQGEVIDLLTMQENLDGLENITQINERIRGRKAEETAWARLQGEAMKPDPNDPSKQTRAMLAVVEILKNPAGFQEILTKFYTDEEPQPTEGQQEMLAEAQPGLPMPADGDITTILSRLEAGGQTQGGVQTVGRIR